MTEVFDRYYEVREWGAGSGDGSSEQAGLPYAQFVQSYVDRQDVETVIDVGCGDGIVASLIDWSTVAYTGVDCVEAVGPDLVMDARLDLLPYADLVLVKDVLQHWPLADIRGFLDRELNRHRLLIVTNDVASTRYEGPVNDQTYLGGWRTLDLETLGYPAQARFDYDVQGEWTKRILVYAADSGRVEERSTSGRSWRRWMRRKRDAAQP